MSRNFGISQRPFNPETWDFDDSLRTPPKRRKYIPQIILIFLAVGILFVGVVLALARDDGRYANEPLHTWFDQLASGKGLCCSFADGFSVQDVDWDVTSRGRYRVRLHHQWIVVPENAVVTEPNRFGPSVVWPYQDSEGVTQIRCFLPGAGA